MSGGLYSHTTRGTGTVLTAAIYNSDHVNHITNQNPSMTGGLADNVLEYQSKTDPGGLGSESLPASMAGELERLRFVIARLLGLTHWYEAPDATLDDLITFLDPPVTLSAADSLLHLQRTENDAVEREVETFQSGSGAGAKFSRRIVGGAANDVAELRDFLGSTELTRFTTSLLLFNVLFGVGASLRLNPSGYLDLTEIAAPAAPGANIARLYVKDASTVTRLAYKDSAGNERVLVDSSETPGALIAILEDQKAAGTAGGTFNSGADQTRTLNTEVYVRDSLVTLASNQFTLPAGSWEIEWEAPAGDVNQHQTLLYNVTGAVEVARGSSAYEASGSVISISRGRARVTPAISTTYEIRHRALSTSSTANGLGLAGNFGTEVYTRVAIYKA